MTYSGCPLSTSGDAAFGDHEPMVDLWEAKEGGGEGPALGLNNSCGYGRAFVPNNGCASELGRRCSGEWVRGDRAACTRCALEANLSLCGRCPNPPCVPRSIERWCQGYHNFTTGVSCATAAGGPVVYEDDLFTDFAVSKVQDHPSTATPLFVFFALHAAHTPLQAREDVLSRFDFIASRGDKPEHTRQVYATLISEADRVVARLVQAFKGRGLWNNTLHVFLSDNGGPSYLNGTSGANNYPLKGEDRRPRFLCSKNSTHLYLGWDTSCE